MGKYAALTRWLRQSNADRVWLTFSELESILGFPLPESAHKYQVWWGNDMKHGHTQAKGWMEAGYASSNASAILTNHVVEFSKCQ